MMNRDESGLPILRPNGHQAGEMVGVPVQLSGMPLKLDKNGLFGAVLIRLPDGSLGPVPDRANIVDAEQLCEMFRGIVREEIANSYQRFKFMAEQASRVTLPKSE